MVCVFTPRQVAWVLYVVGVCWCVALLPLGYLAVDGRRSVLHVSRPRQGLPHPLHTLPAQDHALRLG